eukprot:gene9781-11490_t
MSIYRLSNYNTCNGRLRQPDHIMGENPADFSRRMIVSVSARLALLLLEGCFVYYCVLAENSEQYQALRRRLALQTLSITDVGENQITVNAGVTTLLVTLTGASGGRALNSAHGQYGLGGLGGVITAYIAVIPGENLKFFIGGAGTSNGAGGFNGGGSPCINANLPGGSGGGATDLRRSPYGLANRLLVAGGGGGAYSEYIANGGAGGYPNGADGDQGDGVYRTPSAYPPGGGGTQTQGGTGTNGQAGALGQGGNCQGANGAGGGGGYYGGGSAFAVGCGGGSSYASAGYVSSGVATATGDGSAVVSWDIEPTITPSTNPSTESTGGGIYSGDSPTSSSRKTSNIVLVTGGSIIGGLLLLWCGHRLLRWYVLAVDARERKNEMRVIIERKQSLLIMDLLSTDINARSRIDRGRGRGAYATGPPMTDSALCIAPNTAAATPPHHVPELVNLPHEVGSCEVSSISASGLGSESSLVLSSLHSSEMSLFDNSEVLKNGVLSELSTPIALSLHTQSRSQESAMEEGNVATEGSNNEYSDITSEDSIQVSSESEDN